MALSTHNFLHLIYLEFGLDAGKSWLAVPVFFGSSQFAMVKAEGLTA